jgi:hypothetical protein
LSNAFETCIEEEKKPHTLHFALCDFYIYMIFVRNYQNASFGTLANNVEKPKQILFIIFKNYTHCPTFQGKYRFKLAIPNQPTLQSSK